MYMKQTDDNFERKQAHNSILHNKLDAIEAVSYKDDGVTEV